MFSVNALHRLRPRHVYQALRSTHVSAARHGAPFAVSYCGGASGKQLAAVRRSFLLPSKVQSHCPSIRFLSAPTHSEDGELIYTGPLGTAVRSVKIFSYTTTMASLFIMPKILLSSGIGIQSVPLQVAFCTVIGFFTFLTPVILHVLTKGYVIRLYHHPEPDTYTAVTCSALLMDKKTVFHQGDVSVPDVSGLFTTFKVNNKGMLVNPDLFVTPQEYNHLMGYDKPFSFDDMDTPSKS